MSEINYQAPASRYATVADDGYSGTVLLLGLVGAGFSLYFLAAVSGSWFAEAKLFSAQGLVWESIGQVLFALPKLLLLASLVTLFRFYKYALRAYCLCWAVSILHSAFFYFVGFASVRAPGERLSSVNNSFTSTFEGLEVGWLLSQHMLPHLYYFVLVTLIFLKRRAVRLYSSVS